MDRVRSGYKKKAERRYPASKKLRQTGAPLVERDSGKVRAHSCGRLVVVEVGVLGSVTKKKKAVGVN